MTENFNIQLGRKLRQAREHLEYTLEEAAKKIGFNHYQTLSSIEDGSRPTKSSELTKLAEMYQKSISYFLGSIKEFEAPIVLWREKSNVKGVKAKEEEFFKYCKQYYYLEKKLGLEKRSLIRPLDLFPDDFDYNKISEIASNYLKEMGFGARPSCSLRKILEDKYNVKILFLDLDGYGSGACTVNEEFGAAILINSLEPVWRRNFDLAHELFHLLTWNIFRHDEIHSIEDKKSCVEKFADSFAACLLLPTDEVRFEFNKKLNDGKISILDLVGIAREFEVSTSALLWRLVGLKELGKNDVTALLDSESFKEVDKSQRVGDHETAPFISENYVKLAFTAFRRDLISKGKLAECLGVNIGEVSSRLSDFGYSEGDVYDEELTVA